MFSRHRRSNVKPALIFYGLKQRLAPLSQLTRKETYGNLDLFFICCSTISRGVNKY